jgi:hypothetical protein
MPGSTVFFSIVKRMRATAAAAAAVAVAATAGVAEAADPVRGASLYANPARPGMLPCADCHAENPIVDNFGNIWSGRNAVALIERAVQSNTGGMGVFQGVYGPAELADIAAFLGNAPNTLSFAPAIVGSPGATRTVTVSSSLKTGIDGLTLATEGDFVLAGTTCGPSVPRFSSCAVEVAFRPSVTGARAGTLIIDHRGTPTPVRLPLSGEGLPPPAVAQVFPLRIDFGAAGIQRHVQVANDSDTPLALRTLTTAPAGFAVVGGTCLPGLALAAGQRCTVALRAPARDGNEQRGTLTLTHDGIGGSTTVDLAASGPVLPSRVLHADAAALDFGTQTVGATVPPRLLNVTNLGATALTLREVSFTDAAFAIDGATCAPGRVLAPQQACQVAVVFHPSREGPVTAELRFLTHEAAPELRVGLSARAGASAIQAVPGRVALRASVGKTARASLALVNAGAAPWRVMALTIGGPEAADFALDTDGSCAIGSTVGAGTHCTLTVAFSPSTAGTSFARLRIGVEGGSTDIELAGRGTSVAAPEVWMDAGSIDFGIQPIGATGTVRTIDVHNRGDADLRWSQVALTGVGAGDFTLGGDCVSGAPLLAGASCRAELRFTAGSREQVASLVFWHDGAAAPAVAILRGRGVDSPSTSLVADRLAIDFGRWPLQAPAAVQQFRLRNDGSAVAPPLSFAIDHAAFSVKRSDVACRRGLMPGMTCTVEVTFAPAGGGAYDGALQITAAGLPPVAVALAGAAVPAAPLLAWQSQAFAPSHDTAFVGAPSPGPVWTLVNEGNAPSAPLRWIIDGAAASDFSVAPGSTCESGRVLAAGAACTLQASFHPRAAGIREARLLLASDAIDPRPLEGRGVAGTYGTLDALPRTVAFQARTNATAAPQRVLLRNDGTAGLTIEALDTEGAAFHEAVTPADACGGELRVLLPGESCEVAVTWDGSAAGLPGGRLLASAGSGAFGTSAQLVVREDPAQRTNAGGGGGSWHWSWLLALAALLARREAVRSEFRHGCRDHHRC